VLTTLVTLLATTNSRS